MIVVVTGSRDFADYSKIELAMNEYKPDVVVHGGASGADMLANSWCKKTGTTVMVVPALWDHYGKLAGPIRNNAMLDLAIAIANQTKQDIKVAAFPLSSSIGTFDCMRKAVSKGLNVKVFTDFKD